MVTLYAALLAVVFFMQSAAAQSSTTTTAAGTTAPTPSTAYIEVFHWDGNNNPDPRYWSRREGSIISVDSGSDETTIAVSCRPTMLDSCSTLWTTTLIIAPSKSLYLTYIETSRAVSDRSTSYIVSSLSIRCDITPSSSAYCTTTAESRTSHPEIDATSSTTSTNSSTIFPPSMSHANLLVTAGIEKLGAATSPTAATATPTSAPTEDSSSDPEPSSNAWIAGPVIGAIAGFGIIAGVVFWSIRRRSREALAEGPEKENNRHGQSIHGPALLLQEPSESPSHQSGTAYELQSYS